MRRVSILGIYLFSPDFYLDSVFHKIEDWLPEFSIFVGDWNVCLDPEKDTKNYLHINNPNAMETLKEQIDKQNLVDVWRHLNPDKRTFSWRQFNSNKQSRLDYFLISSSLLPFIKSASIIPGICSDHSVIDMEIDFSQFNRGRGFWKFNASLLGETPYRDLIKSTIKRVSAQYAIINHNENFFETSSAEELEEFYSNLSPESLQSLDLTINP